MSKAKFTKPQLKDLIEVYQAEVKKLNFQIQNARAIIKGLKEDLKNAPDAEVAQKTPVKKTTAKKTPAKKVTAKKAPAKKAADKKATTKKVVAQKAPAKKATAKRTKKADGRKGNAGRKPVVTAFDNFVMTAINEAGKGLVSSDLFVAVKAKAKAAGEYKDDVTTKTLINRALQKLVNKQKMLAKFKHAGRGYAYGLPSWGSRGRLKPAYKA